MKIKKELELVKYIALVDNLAKEYFDIEGNFTPHFGELNAMRCFYNFCVEDDIAGLPHNLEDVTELVPLIKNKKFLKAFTVFRKNRADNCELTFGNAYETANLIVDERKFSFNRITEVLKITIGNLLDEINNVLLPENIEKIEKIANEIKDGNISADTIAEAVGKSETFKQIISSKKAE